MGGYEISLDADNKYDYLGPDPEDPEDRPIHPGGRKPERLKSSWHLHDRTPPPIKPPVYKIAVDRADTGETMCTAPDIEAAYSACVDIKKETGVTCVIRPFVIDEGVREHDKDFRKEKSQFNRLYEAPGTVYIKPRKNYD